MTQTRMIGRRNRTPEERLQSAKESIMSARTLRFLSVHGEEVDPWYFHVNEWTLSLLAECVDSAPVEIRDGFNGLVVNTYADAVKIIRAANVSNTKVWVASLPQWYRIMESKDSEIAVYPTTDPRKGYRFLVEARSKTEAQDKVKSFLEEQPFEFTSASETQTAEFRRILDMHRQWDAQDVQEEAATAAEK